MNEMVNFDVQIRYSVKSLKSEYNYIRLKSKISFDMKLTG